MSCGWPVKVSQFSCFENLVIFQLVHCIRTSSEQTPNPGFAAFNSANRFYNGCGYTRSSPSARRINDNVSAFSAETWLPKIGGTCISFNLSIDANSTLHHSQRKPSLTPRQNTPTTAPLPYWSVWYMWWQLQLSLWLACLLPAVLPPLVVLPTTGPPTSDSRGQMCMCW